ncbi:uncharacterized protein LOC9661050 [Selaginella moellendorffii]|uniref:uncharacterized protein LOC9661050 n=1 Tax=Selaginella moellendorffii TaxID=88036 RepID=UPI000D1CB39A|nr:uncharacterized protein LOC9661050 [Selaginella moellendorffii]|eukprot:XP_024543473.1 uncharacterized protein LOC9661050 [Selaginella moellendorffii]
MVYRGLLTDWTHPRAPCRAALWMEFDLGERQCWCSCDVDAANPCLTRILDGISVRLGKHRARPIWRLRSRSSCLKGVMSLERKPAILENSWKKEDLLDPASISQSHGAIEMFASMQGDHGVDPIAEHYGCVVRCGHLLRRS